MERKKDIEVWDDFEDWKLVRGADEETHQIEFALK
jgi:hypothetical protein